MQASQRRGQQSLPSCSLRSPKSTWTWSSEWSGQLYSTLRRGCGKSVVDLFAVAEGPIEVIKQ